MSVKIIRLSTGEELIATVKVDQNSEMVLEDVAILIPTSENQLGLAPFMAYGNYTELRLQRKDIMFSIEPNDQLAETYRKMFRKIITPLTKTFIVD